MFGYFPNSNLWTVLSSIALLAVSITAHTAPTVKQSSSGLCHSEESPNYDRTKTFTGYESLKECTQNGGQLRDGLVLARYSESNSEYDRSKFGHGWQDTDGDCQNSRMEALISQSTRSVQFADDDRCRVTQGRWISTFTGKVITDASKIDIDHAVLLKFAWEHGADTWSQEKRVRFANDPVNLLSVEARFLRLVKQYDLKSSPPENRWIRSFLDSCRS